MPTGQEERNMAEALQHIAGLRDQVQNGLPASPAQFDELMGVVRKVFVPPAAADYRTITGAPQQRTAAQQSEVDQRTQQQRETEQRAAQERIESDRRAREERQAQADRDRPAHATGT